MTPELRLSGSHRPGGRYRLAVAALGRMRGRGRTDRRSTLIADRPARAAACLGAATALLFALSGCGSATTAKSSRSPVGAGRDRRAVTLILDFTPNAVHAGLYRALAAGYYRKAGIELKVVQPTSTQETLKLIDAGRAQFGLADGSDVAALIEQGGDAQAVMALVDRPLGGLIALRSERLRS